jgi:hypothetical protein
MSEFSNMEFKKTGDPKIDFPEIYLDDDIDDFDKHLAETEIENKYIKKILIEEVLENVEIKKDNGVYDKRLRRPLFKRILDAVFGNDRI